MKAKTIAKLALIPILVKVIGHSIGHMGWDTPADPRIMDIVSAMKGYTGEFMGSGYNMAEYYTGYSMMILIVYIITCFMIWFISDLYDTHPDIAKRLLMPIGLGYFVFAVVEFRYFFPFAAWMSVLAGVIVIFSVIWGKK
jgi:hypothetical protein